MPENLDDLYRKIFDKDRQGSHHADRDAFDLAEIYKVLIDTQKIMKVSSIN